MPVRGLKLALVLGGKFWLLCACIKARLLKHEEDESAYWRVQGSMI